MDLAQWLAELGLGQYAAAFAENDIGFDVLSQLTDADLKELGVSSLGNRKRLLAAIAARASDSATATPRGEISKGERRQVTILFADLCGFTALSQSLDPEEVHELVARYTALVDGIVASYGGTVDKHIGDAVMALFGAPKAHEDDPLRAARAAFDIHEALAPLTDSRRRPLQAHVGIASGEVVAGSLERGGAHDYTVLGDSVNLAARLVAAAGPGQTLLSNTVYRTLAGRGLCDDLGEIALKGFDEPTQVWRLRAISADQPLSNRTAFVGRKAELNQFNSLCTACLARRSGQVVYVRGDAGIGKTRLVEEMRRFAEASGFAAHRGLVLDFGVARGHDPVRAILLSLLGLSPSAAAESRQALVEHLVTERVVARESAAFLNDLLELPQTIEQRALYDAMDAAARERGKRALAAALLAHSSKAQPTLLIVEDLHWADQQVLAYLASFASALSDVAGLLVVTSRVEGDQLDAAWRASCRGTPFATIDLGPLRGDEALTLVGHFIDATHSVAVACIERADGNPLFLEQLLRNAQEGSRDAIPASIQSLVQARMDRLSARDRDAFQIAAVIGQRFDLELLRHLMAASDYTCTNLIDNALAIPEGEDFLFAHALIQEGAYSSMLRSRRRELHGRAAEWYSERDLILSAQHFDRAEDERAAKAYLRAAGAQRSRYDIDGALRLAVRGSEIARDTADRHALTCLKGELQRDLGDIASSVQSYREALKTAPDAITRCQAEIGLAEGLRVSEGLNEALQLLDQAQETAEKQVLTGELARIHHLRGNIFFPLGNIDGCRDEHQRGFVYARRLNSPEAEARALGGLADAAYAQGRMRSAFEYFSQCVSLSREHGFGKIEVANRSMIGFSRIYLNEVQLARQDGDAAARAAVLVGQPRAELLGETMGVFATYELGDSASMERYLARKMQLAQQLGARRFEAQALEMKARVLLDTGQRKEAAHILRQALAICREVGTQFCGPKVASALARAVEDAETRAAVLAEGQEMLGRGAVGHNHLWFYRDAIEALLMAGEGARALTYVSALEDYTRAEPLPWSALFAQRGRLLVEALHGISEDSRTKLADIRSSLERVGFKPFLPAVNAALDR
jgi:class 3 adenylate cyclase/tetratricopeptide (TPR) repeat protein